MFNVLKYGFAVLCVVITLIRWRQTASIGRKVSDLQKKVEKVQTATVVPTAVGTVEQKKRNDLKVLKVLSGRCGDDLITTDGEIVREKTMCSLGLVLWCDKKSKYAFVRDYEGSIVYLCPVPVKGETDESIKRPSVKMESRAGDEG